MSDTKHTPGIEEMLPEGPQAYVPDERGRYFDAQEAAEIAKLKDTNAELLKTLEYIEMCLANDTVNAHTFEIIRCTIAKAKGD